ncbi:small ribosomal subunit protein uS17m [Bacillus rossius redtenbacheri]|uniref:small ribosomal subunit protein uS17m n=1 Tax=Bacillus rossius redtenbacheri TaxID=93214 RepID=UPI002FDD5077
MLDMLGGVYKIINITMSVPSAARGLLLLGRCVPSVKPNASKFRIRRLELDRNILMYFSEDQYIYAHDPEKLCKEGDVALVQELPQKMTRLITHTVLRVVYPLGDITDPVTGKKVMQDEYRDEMDDINRLYGESKNAFKYREARERGWQEDKKDFSHRESYVKYHEFEDDDQPYAL